MERDCEFTLSSKARVLIYDDVDNLRASDRLEFRKHSTSLVLSVEEWGEIRKIVPTVYKQMREAYENMDRDHPGLYSRNQQIQFFHLSDRTSGLFATQSNLITGETVIVFCLRRLSVDSHGAKNLFEMTQANAHSGLIFDVGEVESLFLKSGYIGDALTRKSAYRYRFEGTTKREAEETVKEASEEIRNFLTVGMPNTEIYLVVKHRGRFAPYQKANNDDDDDDDESEEGVGEDRVATPFPPATTSFFDWRDNGKDKVAAAAAAAAAAATVAKSNPSAAPRRRKKQPAPAVPLAAPPPTSPLHERSQASEEDELEFFDEDEEDDEDEWTLVDHRRQGKNKKKKQKKQHEIAEEETVEEKKKVEEDASNISWG